MQADIEKYRFEKKTIWRNVGMEFTEKKVLVFGTGISGVAAANLLENAGAEVVLFDGNEKLDKHMYWKILQKAKHRNYMLGYYRKK